MATPESNLHGEIPFVPYYGFTPDIPKPKEVTPPQVVEGFPKKLRADVEEAYGNAIVNAFKETCYDAVCGCPFCISHATSLRNYFDELPKVPDRWEGKSFLRAFDRKVA